MTDLATDVVWNSGSPTRRASDPVTSGQLANGTLDSPSYIGSSSRRKLSLPRVSGMLADGDGGDARTSLPEPRSSSGECTSNGSLTGKRQRDFSPNTNGTITNGTKETYESDNTVHRIGHSVYPDSNGTEQQNSAENEEQEGRNEEQEGRNEEQEGTPSDKTKCDKTKLPRPEGIVACPRCASEETKFCYYNNYNVNQPRYFCKACQRYWTAGGTLRNVPVGSGRRKNKSASKSKEQGSGSASAAKSGKMDLVAPYQFQPMLLDPSLYAATVAQTPDLQAALAAQFMPAALSGAALNPALGAVAGAVPALPIGPPAGTPGNLTQIAEQLRQLHSSGQTHSSDALKSSCTAVPGDFRARSNMAASSLVTDPSEDGSINGRRVRLKTPGSQSLRSAFGGAFAPPASTTTDHATTVSSSAMGVQFLSQDSSMQEGTQAEQTVDLQAALANGNLHGFQPVCNPANSDLSIGSLQKSSMEWLSYAAVANQQQAAAQQLQQAAAIQAQAQLQAAAAAGWATPQNPYLNGLWPYGLYNAGAPNWAAYSARFGPPPGWMDPTAAATLAAAAQAQMPRPPAAVTPVTSVPPPVPSILYPTAQRTSPAPSTALQAAAAMNPAAAVAAAAAPSQLQSTLSGGASVGTSQPGLNWPSWPNFAPGLAWPSWPGMANGVTGVNPTTNMNNSVNNSNVPVAGGQIPGLLQAKALQAMQMQHSGFEALVGVPPTNHSGESAASNRMAAHALGM